MRRHHARREKKTWTKTKSSGSVPLKCQHAHSQSSIKQHRKNEYFLWHPKQQHENWNLGCQMNHEHVYWHQTMKHGGKTSKPFPIQGAIRMSTLDIISSSSSSIFSRTYLTSRLTIAMKILSRSAQPIPVLAPLQIFSTFGSLRLCSKMYLMLFKLLCSMSRWWDITHVGMKQINVVAWKSGRKWKRLFQQQFKNLKNFIFPSEKKDCSIIVSVDGGPPVTIWKEAKKCCSRKGNDMYASAKQWETYINVCVTRLVQAVQPHPR